MAEQAGDGTVDERMNQVREDASWWVDGEVLRFRSSAYGDAAPWGMSVVAVRMSRETGRYVMHVQSWIDEGAAGAGEGPPGSEGGEELEQLEGT